MTGSEFDVLIRKATAADADAIAALIDALGYQ